MPSVITPMTSITPTSLKLSMKTRAARNSSTGPSPRDASRIKWAGMDRSDAGQILVSQYLQRHHDFVALEAGLTETQRVADGECHGQAYGDGKIPIHLETHIL